MHALAAVYLNQSCPCGMLLIVCIPMHKRLMIAHFIDSGGGWFTGKSRLLTVCDGVLAFSMMLL
jgi:hypothetical protein